MKAKNVIAVAFLAVTVNIVFVQIVGAVTIDTHTMCKATESRIVTIGGSTGYGACPVNETTKFDVKDSKAVCLLQIELINRDDTFRFEWYNPSNSLYQVDNSNSNKLHLSCWWSTYDADHILQGWEICWLYASLKIAGYPPSNIKGNWHVDFYYNDEKQFTEAFTISSGHGEVFDGRIGIVVDKVERSDTYPADFEGNKTPAEGYDYCIIHFTVSRINGGHIFALLGDMMDSTALLDQNGQTFHVKNYKFTGIDVRDVHDITSEKAFMEGSTGILLFEIPVQSDPSNLQLAYFFGESWDDYYSPTPSRININLVEPDGDVAPLGNRDGIVNVGDALVCLRFALGLETPTQEDMNHGDVAPLDANGQPNPDRQITVGDALVILRKALGIIQF